MIHKLEEVELKNFSEYALWYNSPAIFKEYVCNFSQKYYESLICPQFSEEGVNSYIYSIVK